MRNQRSLSILASRAVKAANRIESFMQLLVPVLVKYDSRKLDALKKEWNAYTNILEGLLDTITGKLQSWGAESSAGSQRDIEQADRYYFDYLFQQIYRFNALFTVVKITRDDEAEPEADEAQRENEDVDGLDTAQSSSVARSHHDTASESGQPLNQNNVTVWFETITRNTPETSPPNQVSATSSASASTSSGDEVIDPHAPTHVKLVRHGLQPIRHAILGLPAKLTIKVSVNTDGLTHFREAYTHQDKRGHTYYHYAEKATADGKPHQEYRHYQQANSAIFKDTQLSNVNASIFANPQQRHDYFKGDDKQGHTNEKNLFCSAQRKIRAGEVLTQEELNVLRAGKFYRYADVMPKADNRSHGSTARRITHIGHASEIITLADNQGPALTVHTDPAFYQPHTDGVFVPKVAALTYGRQTQPALTTDALPPIQVVIISHNHHDHLCKRTLLEAYKNTNTLFIVPKGDGALLRRWGFPYVVELSSWNESVNISIKNSDTQKESHYEVRAFPAKHASGRTPTDFYQSLYMGCLIRAASSREYTFVSGDTGVLDEEHRQELQRFLIDTNRLITAACIASGPDRPRRWMECTHQSSADAIVFWLQLSLMNAAVLAKAKAHKVSSSTLTATTSSSSSANSSSSSSSSLPKIDRDTFLAAVCQGIGYHQGCYRLGLLSYRDVFNTVARFCALLNAFGEASIHDITQTQLDNQFTFIIMDDFEQSAFKAMLASFSHCEMDGPPLTANDIKHCIEQHFVIPHPGMSILGQVHETRQFQYRDLLINQITVPAQQDSHWMFILKNIDMFITGNPATGLAIEYFLTCYLSASNKLGFRGEKIKKVSAFLQNGDDEYDSHPYTLTDLNNLFLDVQSTNGNEQLRDEGLFYTVMVTLVGFLTDSTFRDFFLEQYRQVHPALEYN